MAPIETGRTPRASLAMEAVDLYATPGSYDADKVFLYERSKRPRARRMPNTNRCVQIASISMSIASRKTCRPPVPAYRSIEGVFPLRSPTATKG